MPTSAEHKSITFAGYGKRIPMSENFSSGTKHPGQTNKQTNLLVVNLVVVLGVHRFCPLEGAVDRGSLDLVWETCQGQSSLSAGLYCFLPREGAGVNLITAGVCCDWKNKVKREREREREREEREREKRNVPYLCSRIRVCPSVHRSARLSIIAYRCFACTLKILTSCDIKHVVNAYHISISISMKTL